MPKLARREGVLTTATKWAVRTESRPHAKPRCVSCTASRTATTPKVAASAGAASHQNGLWFIIAAVPMPAVNGFQENQAGNDAAPLMNDSIKNCELLPIMATN